jgi:hypothetical protein
LQNQFSSEFKALLGPVERLRRLIWAASFFAIIFFIGLGAILIPGTAGQDTTVAVTDSSALAPFHFAAMAFAVISLLIRSYGFSDHRLKKWVADSPALNDEHPAPMNLSEPERRLWKLFRAIMPVQVIGWSINELVIALGLAAAWFSGRFEAIYPFAFMALVLHVLMFPRFAPFARRVEALGPVPRTAGIDPGSR